MLNSFGISVAGGSFLNLYATCRPANLVPISFPVSRLFRKQKTTPLSQGLRQKEKEFYWGAASEKWISAGLNDAGMEAGNYSNDGSFWHQVLKKPELWAGKGTCLFNINIKLTSDATVRLRHIKFDAEHQLSRCRYGRSKNKGFHWHGFVTSLTSRRPYDLNSNQ